MIRLRATDLDQYLRFLNPPSWLEVDEDEALAEFLAHMRREGEANDAMKAGSALHSLIEHAKPGEEWGINSPPERDGFTFRFDLDDEIALPAEREPEVMEYVVDTHAGPVLLRGRIDARDIAGTIYDWKLTSKFDAEQYGESMQWRSYLMMTGAVRFAYRIFESRRTGKVVTVKAVHPLEFFRYTGMEAEVARVAGDLADFVQRALPDAEHLYQVAA